LELQTLRIKKLKTENFTFFALVGYLFWKTKSRNLKQLALLKSTSAALTLTRIVWQEMCILQFRTEAEIYSKIMQNHAKHEKFNNKKQLKTHKHSIVGYHQNSAAAPMICQML